MTNATLIEDMPLCMGAMKAPLNPEGLPSVYPFCMNVNHKLGRLEQGNNTDLADILTRAYKVGAEMGTPSDSTDLGRPYVDDFLGFICRYSDAKGKLLEIGAGTGFISKCLMESGWEVTSIEPGHGYGHHWEKRGLKVINDFFPSPHVTGLYDAIVLYTVLEHISDTQSFLENIRRHLKKLGKVFIGVPDCTIEIQAGDPSILFHEHYQYFTAQSLINTMVQAGFNPRLENARYGRSLYAVGTTDAISDQPLRSPSVELETVIKFVVKAISNRQRIRTVLTEWLLKGTVGIYCPSRVLNCLSSSMDVRFYDDDSHLLGKYYPPFTSPVMSRTDLFANPPDRVLVSSRTFGEKIKRELTNNNIPSHVTLISELI